MLLDVMFYEAFAEEAAALRKYLPAAISAGFTASTVQEEQTPQIPARIISVRTQSVIPAGWAGGIAALLSRSTGYDHLSAYCLQTGFPREPCGYLPLYCNRAVAEQAMLLWCALLRRLPRQIRQFRTFQRDGITGGECAARTLLVAGVGNIGHEVTRIGKGLDMLVLGVDPLRKWDDVEYVSLEQGLPAADIVVCAMNLNKSNRALFNEPAFALMKPGAVFINVARGELVHTAALRAALTNGRLGGAGLDVYANEPELAVALRGGGVSEAAAGILALAELPNVICTPHNAFNTAEAVERKAEQSIEQIRQFLAHGVFIWPLPAED